MTNLTRDPHSLIGRTLGEKYRVNSLLGKGGFGAVYRATQEPVGREVAVKVIGVAAQDRSLRARFFREAKVLGRLTDPGTVTLFDYGEEADGLLYMVQELIIGHPLSTALRRGARIEPERAVRIAIQMLHALEEAHALGIIHRDIKPGNVMVTKGREGEEVVKVLDFGVAKLLVGPGDGYQTTRGQTVGTPAYMAPEQTKAKGIVPATDLYSVGILLYRMLVGELPYKAASHFETMMMHRKAPLPDMAAVPPPLVPVLQTTLAKKPADRYADAVAMRHALEAAWPTARLPTGSHAKVVLPPVSDGPTVRTPVSMPSMTSDVVPASESAPPPARAPVTSAPPPGAPPLEPPQISAEAATHGRRQLVLGLVIGAVVAGVVAAAVVLLT